MRRSAWIAVLAFLISGFAQTSSLAVEAPQPVPSEVRAFVDDRLVSEVHAVELEDATGTLVPVVPASANVTTSKIIAVNLFTDEFQLGQSSEQILVAENQWALPLYSKGEPIGTAQVAAYDGHVSLANADLDADLAVRLHGITEEQHLVYYPQANEYYALDGTMVSPLSANARTFLSQPVPVSVFQEALQHRIALADANAGPGHNLVGMLDSSLTPPVEGTNWLTVFAVASGVTALLVAGVAVAWNRKDKEHTAPRRSVG